ncbi:helix-turn-helix domain-containing protein [Streptomyces sp. NPDC089919]|uniref:helix-turn-helix domain-containing protein n=1 Tax=Streptomyces sp. NPDC089919 TaxID=3155188 RepID=UPI003442E4B2
MQVEHLLQDESLGLRLLWDGDRTALAAAAPAARAGRPDPHGPAGTASGRGPGPDRPLAREVSGVTATDLEDPARFLRPGEVVLTGLVWWTPEGGRAQADRFVAALCAAGAAALLAGEETHGAVPEEITEACRAEGMVLIAVPAHISFRAVTDAVYLRQWSELSRHPDRSPALPAGVRDTLHRLVAAGAPPGELLATAFAHLSGPPASLVTAAGRVIARTGPAVPGQSGGAAAETGRAAGPGRGAGPLGTADPGLVLRVDSGGSAYDTWHLHLAEADRVPPRVLSEIVELLAQRQEAWVRERRSRRPAADALAAVVAGSAGGAVALDGALRACALPGEGRYLVLAATASGSDGDPGETAADALAEALAAVAPAGWAVGRAGGGEAVGILELPAEAAAEGADERSPERSGAARPEAGRAPSAGRPAAGAGRPAPGPGGRPDGEVPGLPGLARVWRELADCDPAAVLHAGIGRPVAAAGLYGALDQARFALTSARASSPLAGRIASTDELDGLGALLSGVPAEVREVYRTRTLGPLLEADNASADTLLQTLVAFLDHHGSWARTAETLHLHVNTVHYRIQRIEALTGRDLSRLDDRLDLLAALLCR